jgi:hypothetical protein
MGLMNFDQLTAVIAKGNRKATGVFYIVTIGFINFTFPVMTGRATPQPSSS